MTETLMSLSPRDFVKRANQDIDGWFSEREGMAFYDIARTWSAGGVAVEIGSWQGKSTVCIARGAMDGGGIDRVYAIDPHVGSEEHQHDGAVWTLEAFRKNIERFGVDSVVTPVVKFSHDAVDDVEQPIAFLFIDGAHDYDSVRRDFEDWFPRVMPGGVIAFHDSHWLGVRTLLGETVYPHPQIRRVHRVLGTTIVEKGPAGAAARITKRLAWYAFDWPIRFKYLRRKLTGRPPPAYT